jgi:hypothetical protein
MKKTILFCSIFFATTITQAQTLNTEQKTIKNTFINFLKFYEKNQRVFNSFELYSGTGKEQAPPYKINWKEVERYFTYLRKSVPYVGEFYISTERINFKYYDSCYKADPTEEMPVGFDYDRWGGGQEEVKYMVQYYTSPKNKYEVKITGNKAILRIGWVDDQLTSWAFVPFVKEKGKWKMADNISPEE